MSAAKRVCERAIREAIRSAVTTEPGLTIKEAGDIAIDELIGQLPEGTDLHLWADELVILPPDDQ